MPASPAGKPLTDEEFLKRLLERVPRPMLEDLLDEIDRQRYGVCALEVRGAKVHGMQFTSKKQARDYGIIDW